jgi:hypothetical protein
MKSSHTPEFRGVVGYPRVFIIIHNVRAVPISDGMLKLHILDHYSHGAAWETIQDHGIGRDVELLLDGEVWHYRLELEHEQVILAPLDRANKTLPDPQRLSRKAVNIKMKW